MSKAISLMNQFRENILSTSKKSKKSFLIENMVSKND